MTIPLKKYLEQTGREKKSLLCNFACILTAIGKVYVLEGRLGTRLSIHPSLKFS